MKFIFFSVPEMSSWEVGCELAHEEVLQKVDLAGLPIKKVSMYSLAETPGFIYIAIECHEPIFNKEYKFSNNGAALFLFNKINEYMATCHIIQQNRT